MDVLVHNIRHFRQEDLPENERIQKLVEAHDVVLLLDPVLVEELEDCEV